MAKTVKLNDWVGRSVEGVKCQECGGFAGRVDCTPKEEFEWGCGRTGCCARAFVCALCGTRHVGCAEAPEME